MWRREAATETAVEVVGILVSAGREKVILEARHRFEIRARAPKSLVDALGKVVGVAVIDGQVRWRLVEVAPEPGKGEQP